MALRFKWKRILKRETLRSSVVFLAALVCIITHARADDAPTDFANVPIRQVSSEQFRANTILLQQLAAACATTQTACDAQSVGGDESIAATSGAPAFVIHWDWLRTALVSAAKARPSDRKQQMEIANAHLAELLADTAAAANTNVIFSQARIQATRILSRAEFQSDTGPSWWDRQIAKFWAMLSRIFSGVATVGENNPWLGPFLEVLLYLAAAVGILFFVRRAFIRQRLAVSLGAGAIKASTWDKEAEDWAALADACATQQRWRDAVHCLYWAAIVRLEARRAWRHNPTRTPREYVRLLKPGSPEQTGLRTLTQIFERVWYGLRDATGADYQQARSLFDRLSSDASEAA